MKHLQNVSLAIIVAFIFGWLISVAYNALFVDFGGVATRMDLKAGISVWVFIFMGVFIKSLYGGEAKIITNYHFHEKEANNG